MKIAAVSVYPGKGEKHVNASGVASYTKNLLKSLPLKADDEVYVICNQLNGKQEQYEEDGFTIMRVFKRNFTFVWHIFRAITAIDADVVHIQQEIPLYGRIHTAYMLPWLLRLLRNRKTIVTLHHTVSLQKIDKDFVRANKSAAPVWLVKFAFRMLYVPLVKHADQVIVHEEHFRDILVDEYDMDEEKITAIPHGVEDFQPLPKVAARKQLAVAPDRHVVLFMGYLAGYKGFDLLLRGFAEYAKKDPKALLLIGAGKHPKFADDPTYEAEYTAYQSMAHQRIPDEQYKWVGFISEDEIGAYYFASDVSLYPYIISMSSSGPMAFSMGYERAFLASDVFANVLPEELLFARSPEALATKLTDFFAQPSHYTQLSCDLKAQRLWSVVGERTVAVYTLASINEAWLEPEEEIHE